MKELIEAADFFIYPLGVFSVVAIFVIVERILGLSSARIIPTYIVEALSNQTFSTVQGDTRSAGGRIIQYWRNSRGDHDDLKAYAQVEVSRMERGMFLLDIVIAAAPLIGLIGTVYGLIEVFHNVTPETGIPETAAFIEDVSLALSTTFLGLIVAIPAIIGNGFLGRRIDVYATKIDLIVERIKEIEGYE